MTEITGADPGVSDRTFTSGKGGAGGYAPIKVSPYSYSGGGGQPYLTRVPGDEFSALLTLERAARSGDPALVSLALRHLDAVKPRLGSGGHS